MLYNIAIFTCSLISSYSTLNENYIMLFNLVLNKKNLKNDNLEQEEYEKIIADYRKIIFKAYPIICHNTYKLRKYNKHFSDLLKTNRDLFDDKIYNYKGKNFIQTYINKLGLYFCILNSINYLQKIKNSNKVLEELIIEFNGLLPILKPGLIKE